LAAVPESLSPKTLSYASIFMKLRLVDRLYQSRGIPGWARLRDRRSEWISRTGGSVGHAGRPS